MAREGTAIGQFRLERLLGHGGMGTVYTAVDEMTGREVAVKLLRPDLLDQSDFVERFKAEARTLARLDHPRIARLYGFFAHADDLLMVMEYVRGETLSAVLRERGALPPATAVAWAGDMFEALHYAHEQGVVHRDVKPANIIIDEQDRARLTDFGIARTLGDSRLTQTGHAVGTIAYMSPEQVMGGQIDGRADLYAAAIVVFEMLTGVIPYAATTTFTLMREVSEGVRPAALDALPPEAAVLRPVLARALSAAPEDRYANGLELREALSAALRGELPADHPRVAMAGAAPARADVPHSGTTIAAEVSTTAAAAPHSGPRARPSLAMLGGGVLALGALIVAGALWTRSPSSASGGNPDPPPASAEVAEEAQPPASAASEQAPQMASLPGGAPAPMPMPPSGVSPAVRPPAKTGSSMPSPARAAPTGGAFGGASGGPPGVASSPPGAGDASAGDEPAAPGTPSGSRNLAPAEFTRALMMVPLEDDDTDEVEVILRFDSRRLVVANAETRVPLRTIGYGSVSGASYSEVPSRLRAFGRGPAHWLDLTVGGEHVVLRLDKRNSTEVISALEARAGLNVQRVTRR